VTETITVFELPQDLGPDLARVLSYWEGLKRGRAEMPFWDDVNLLDVPDLADRIALIDVFDGPERFRFQLVGDELARSQPLPTAGKFLDEVSLARPLDYLQAQCSATVEAGAPTHFETRAAAGSPGAAHRRRIVLPLWGEGQVRTLLVAVE
jgi:hypothetical protein